MSPIVPANNIFVVFCPKENTGLEAVIARVYGDQAKKVWENQWFIVADGTAQEVTNALGILGSDIGSAVVVSVSSYYGRAPKDLWEWLVVAAQRPTRVASAPPSNG